MAGDHAQSVGFTRALTRDSSALMTFRRRTALAAGWLLRRHMIIGRTPSWVGNPDQL
jgi:hypothetical protein